MWKKRSLGVRSSKSHPQVPPLTPVETSARVRRFQGCNYSAAQSAFLFIAYCRLQQPRRIRARSSRSPRSRGVTAAAPSLYAPGLPQQSSPASRRVSLPRHTLAPPPSRLRKSRPSARAAAKHSSAIGFASNASLDHDYEFDSDSKVVIVVPAAAPAAPVVRARPAYPVRISFRAGLVQKHDGRGTAHRRLWLRGSSWPTTWAQAGFPRTMGAVLHQADLGTLIISIGPPTPHAFFLLCVQVHVLLPIPLLYLFDRQAFA